jgi:hypothetical protein
MSDMFLWELYFEYLVPEGACSEAEKYPIYWNIKQEILHNLSSKKKGITL